MAFFLLRTHFFKTTSYSSFYFLQDFYMITAYLRQEDFSWGTWVAQSVEQLTLTFNSGHDLKVLVSSPTGSTLSRESAEDSSSLSVCPPPSNK